jgi:hypothetical protein
MKTSYRRHFLTYEFILSVLLTMIIVYLFEVVWGTNILDQWLVGVKKELYTVIASISGAMLGFIITAVSIVIAFSQSDRFDLLRKSEHYPTLYKIFVVAIKYLAITTGFSVLALILDKDNSPKHWISYILAWGIIATVFSLGRCVWVLEKMISIITMKEM